MIGQSPRAHPGATSSTTSIVTLPKFKWTDGIAAASVGESGTARISGDLPGVRIVMTGRRRSAGPAAPRSRMREYMRGGTDQKEVGERHLGLSGPSTCA